jgi:excinuclease ABC subunit C
MRALGVERIPAVGLAKREEEIYLEDRPEPVRIGRSAPASLLVQQARNEAHRFAVAYHRSLRGQRGLRSQLDAVPGIGPVRRKALLRAFPSMAAMRAASEEELAAVRGMNKTAARAVRAYLDGEKPGTAD